MCFLSKSFFFNNYNIIFHEIQISYIIFSYFALFYYYYCEYSCEYFNACCFFSFYLSIVYLLEVKSESTMVYPSNPRLMNRVLDAVVHLCDGKGSTARDVLDYLRQTSKSTPRNLTMQVTVVEM